MGSFITLPFDSYRPFAMIGLTFILIGLVLLLFPLIPKLTPILGRMEKLRPNLIYIYKHDNFCFVTSPILITIALTFLI